MYCITSHHLMHARMPQNSAKQWSIRLQFSAESNDRPPRRNLGKDWFYDHRLWHHTDWGWLQGWWSVAGRIDLSRGCDPPQVCGYEHPLLVKGHHMTLGACCWRKLTVGSYDCDWLGGIRLFLLSGHQLESLWLWPCCDLAWSSLLCTSCLHWTQLLNAKTRVR